MTPTAYTLDQSRLVENEKVNVILPVLNGISINNSKMCHQIKTMYIVVYFSHMTYVFLNTAPKDLH